MISSGSCSARASFPGAQPGAPQDDDHRSHAPAVSVIGVWRMTTTISSIVAGGPV
jgi:hypothetical protein